MESLLERGEKLDDLVSKSEVLGVQSKAFYKTVRTPLTPSHEQWGDSAPPEGSPHSEPPWGVQLLRRPKAAAQTQSVVASGAGPCGAKAGGGLAPPCLQLLPGGQRQGPPPAAVITAFVKKEVLLPQRFSRF